MMSHDLCLFFHSSAAKLTQTYDILTESFDSMGLLFAAVDNENSGARTSTSYGERLPRGAAWRADRWSVTEAELISEIVTRLAVHLLLDQNSLRERPISHADPRRSGGLCPRGHRHEQSR